MQTPSTINQVREYYRDNQSFYNVLWTEPRTLSMNYGLWTPATRSHAEALANQNRLLEEWLQPSAGNLVLESGCGVGGACMWLADRHPVTVVGITLCPNQADQATRHARSRGFGRRVRFVVMDFTHTAFSDATFARIFASESVCYAVRKEDFVVEAFRLLQPGGRLVVIDGFARTTEIAPQEQAAYDEWRQGWAVPNLATIDDFERHLHDAGFEDVVYRDLTGEIRPSSRRIRWFGRVAYPILSSLRPLGIATRSQVGNARACIRQYDLVHSGLWGLGVFRATKPVRAASARSQG